MDERAMLIDLIRRLLPAAERDYGNTGMDEDQAVDDARELLAREDRDSSPSGVTFQRIDAQGRVQEVPVESILGEKP